MRAPRLPGMRPVSRRVGKVLRGRRRELFQRLRPAEKVALNRVAVLHREHPQLLGGLDPFPRHRDTQSVGERTAGDR